jgi:hypothetical protein
MWYLSSEPMRPWVTLQAIRREDVVTTKVSSDSRSRGGRAAVHGVLLVGRAVDAAIDVASQIAVLTIDRVPPGLDHVDVFDDLMTMTLMSTQECAKK